MKTTTMFLVLGIAGALTACGDSLKKSATVEGEAGRKLTLTKPSSVKLRRGEMAKVDIHIRRQNLPGEVLITFSDLPSGIDVVDAGSRIVGDDGTFTLRASESASLVDNNVAKVTATGDSGVSVTETFEISVKERETAGGK